MNAEQSLLKLDAYCQFRQMATMFETSAHQHLVQSVMALTGQALASFKLSFYKNDPYSLNICNNILNNMMNVLKNSHLKSAFQELVLIAEEAYRNVSYLLHENEAVAA
ncbi:hypothetical protein GT348_05365 [Aristophania vespae]|uniref:Uncharacterized protein n=2 Tax=Aristophania vespae TaxID=2697033 RepID=A0A6P1NE28_9PROT|nr:hypothetical protein [Aristophania vespae]QHI95759.1 hypothetical protein GT348_05365 [Aristophania vespae]UMM63460.1 hypothetical protein DM15PD_04240 [Aristophania vespae]